MNTIDKQYQSLLKDILDNGISKQTRNGETISVFGRQIRHSMSEGFPLLTTKKMPFKTITTELLWFLRGDTNIKYLVNNNCHVWVGDCYKNYVLNMSHMEIQDVLRNDNLMTKEEFINKIKNDDEFAKKWGELGPIYGKQWRNWEDEIFERNEKTKHVFHGTQQIDQIQNLINDLKTNPDSRRLMVNAWNVGELKDMVLPPCHYSFQVYTRELSAEERHPELYHKLASKNYETVDIDKEIHLICNENKVPSRAISLMWNQRSVDTFLGLPFNIASYGLLLEIIAKEVNMVPDELIGNLGDVHLYKNHIKQAKEQLTREPMKLPKIDIHPGILDYELDKLEVDMFKLVDYQSHPAIKAPLSN